MWYHMTENKISYSMIPHFTGFDPVKGHLLGSKVNFGAFFATN